MSETCTQTDFAIDALDDQIKQLDGDLADLAHKTAIATAVRARLLDVRALLATPPKPRVRKARSNESKATIAEADDTMAEPPPGAEPEAEMPSLWGTPKPRPELVTSEGAAA